jgi:hypothetical protein
MTALPTPGVIIKGAERHALDGFIVGQTAPEKQKNGTLTVCTAVYTYEHGLVRVYPVPWEQRAPLWSRIECEVERNPKDSRRESWKVLGDRMLDGGAFAREHFRVGDKAEFSAGEKQAILDEIKVGCVHDLNDKYISMGVVEPRHNSLEVLWKPRRGNPDADAFDLERVIADPNFTSKTDLPLMPYVRFRCQACRNKAPHELSVLSSEVMATMVKMFSQKSTDFRSSFLRQLYTAYLCADKPEWKVYLMLGNSVQYRNAFMIGNALRFKATSKPFDIAYQPRLLGW